MKVSFHSCAHSLRLCTAQGWPLCCQLMWVPELSLLHLESQSVRLKRSYLKASTLMGSPCSAGLYVSSWMKCLWGERYWPTCISSLQMRFLSFEPVGPCDFSYFKFNKHNWPSNTAFFTMCCSTLINKVSKTHQEGMERNSLVLSEKIQSAETKTAMKIYFS